MLQTEFVDKIRRQFTYTDFLKTVLYEIIWKNIVEAGWPQRTIWHMRIVCWMPKATNTHSEYVMLVAFPLKQWLHERVSKSYIAYLVLNVSRRAHLCEILLQNRENF
jgi:hypothetical protein